MYVYIMYWKGYQFFIMILDHDHKIQFDKNKKTVYIKRDYLMNNEMILFCFLCALQTLTIYKIDYSNETTIGRDQKY